jgi:hypothetical protein
VDPVNSVSAAYSRTTDVASVIVRVIPLVHPGQSAPRIAREMHDVISHRPDVVLMDIRQHFPDQA